MDEAFQENNTELLGQGGEVVEPAWWTWYFFRRTMLPCRSKRGEKERSFLQLILSVSLRALCSGCSSMMICFQLITIVWRICSGWVVFYQELSEEHGLGGVRLLSLPLIGTMCPSKEAWRNSLISCGAALVPGRWWSSLGHPCARIGVYWTKAKLLLETPWPVSSSRRCVSMWAYHFPHLDLLRDVILFCHQFVI